MPALRPDIDPDGLLEYSVVFTDRSLNHMSQAFQGVMRDIHATLCEVYGAEQYLPGRNVRWAFKGDICRNGSWYEQAGLICFVYEHDPGPQCWNFWRQDGRLTGLFIGDGFGSELSEVAQSPDPLACAGPDLGV